LNNESSGIKRGRQSRAQLVGGSCAPGKNETHRRDEKGKNKSLGRFAVTAMPKTIRLLPEKKRRYRRRDVKTTRIGGKKRKTF